MMFSRALSLAGRGGVLQRSFSHSSARPGLRAVVSSLSDDPVGGIEQLRLEEMAEPDLRLSAALALNGWRPSNALDRAVEYWEFDMEHGLQPQHIGTKWNLKASPQF